MDLISIEKIRAMKKYNNGRRQLLLPTLALYMMATFVFFLLISSPFWFPRLCSFLVFFFLTTVPDLAMAFLLSPKCLFVVGNLIVAFLVGESRLALRGTEPASSLTLMNVIHEEHVKRNAVTSTKTRTVVAAIDHNALVGAVEQGEEDDQEEQGEEEELHKRVEDFIARVRRQRRLEGKNFLDTDR